MYIYFVLIIITGASTVHLASLGESQDTSYAHMQQNIVDTELQLQINSSIVSVLSNLANYDAYVGNLTDQVVDEYRSRILEKVSTIKSRVNHVQGKGRSFISGQNTVVIGCLFENGKLDILATKINEKVKKCATVAMAEMVNVVTDSLKEAQTFMSIPRVIGRDIQRCGLSYNCRWDIVNDAISESLQVPPKVNALTAKIQQIALRTIVSVDSCGLQGLREISQTAVEILEDIFLCISNNIESNNSTTVAT